MHVILHDALYIYHIDISPRMLYTIKRTTEKEILYIVFGGME